MNYSPNISELFKDFELKFGFKTYEGIKTVFNQMWLKIQELEKSRDNWRKKYEELKKKDGG